MNGILIAQIINFAILLAVLLKFVYKPVMKMLDERKEGVAQALEREEKAAEKLASADTEREKILAEARVTTSAMLEEAKRDGEEVKKKLLASAKEEIAKMRDEAQKKLREEKTRLLTEVKGEVGSLIVSTIEQTLGDVLDARTQGKWLNKHFRQCVKELKA